MKYSVTEQEILRVAQSIRGRMAKGKTSERKKRSSRLNGLKGGRPRKAQLSLAL